MKETVARVSNLISPTKIFKMADKKTEILKQLKRFKRMPTSKIGVLIGLPFSNTKRYLEELEKENKVKKIVETNSTYWELR